MVLVVFYRIPDKHRLIVRFKNTKINNTHNKSFLESKEIGNDHDAGNSSNAGDKMTVERLLVGQIEEEAIE